MAGKSKGGRNKAKADAASQAASVEPEVPVADVIEEAKPENAEVSEAPAAAADGGAADVEKEEGDAAAVAAQPAEKPAEGEDARLRMSYRYVCLP